MREIYEEQARLYNKLADRASDKGLRASLQKQAGIAQDMATQLDGETLIFDFTQPDYPSLNSIPPDTGSSTNTPETSISSCPSGQVCAQSAR